MICEWRDARKELPPRSKHDPEGSTERVLLGWKGKDYYDIGYYEIDECAYDITNDQAILRSGWGCWYCEGDIDDPTHWMAIPPIGTDKKHVGSNFDDFLKEEGLLDELVPTIYKGQYGTRECR